MGQSYSTDVRVVITKSQNRITTEVHQEKFFVYGDSRHRVINRLLSHSFVTPQIVFRHQVPFPVVIRVYVVTDQKVRLKGLTFFEHIRSGVLVFRGRSDLRDQNPFYTTPE